MMNRLLLRTSVFVWILSMLTVPVLAQVSTDPQPARTDEPVTVTLDATEAEGNLDEVVGDIHAHTGVYTDQSPEEWTCVKNFWPTEPEFPGNRDDTRLDPVEGEDGLFELQIDDIRAYYNDNETGCTLGDDEEITSMNFVFRTEDGSQQTEDLFADVIDVGDDPFLSVNITDPESDPPLYPFMTSEDETVEVVARANVANADLTDLRLFIDDDEVGQTSEDEITFELDLDTPGQRDVRAEATATPDENEEELDAEDETLLIRTPDVVEEDRPADVRDGINYHADDSRVTLSFYGPEKDFAYVLGDFNDWTIDDDYFMKREATDQFGDEDGYHWWIEIDGLSAGEEYAFQYFVDGEIRMGDIFSEKVLTPEDEFISEGVYPDLKPYPEEETEEIVSVLETGQEEFDTNFDRPDPDELVIYELLIRDFLEGDGTYGDLIDKLDYLEDLGVNAIELMPVSNFDDNDSWGYNPNFHLALEKSYGPREEFEAFIEAAHERGMAVILDVVYNHATDRSPLIQLEGNSPDGSRFVGPGHDFNVFNHLNHDHEYIQYWMDRANEHWLETYNVDGYRFDLTKGFVTMEPDNDFEVGEFNPNPFYQRRVENIERMADAMWDVDDGAYIILEHFQREEELEMAEYRRDEGLQGVMFWQNMKNPYNQSSMGHLEEGADLSDTYHPNIGLDADVPNAITYMESHDEQWLMRRKKEFGNETDDYSTQDLETALERQKLVGAFFFTVPGPRMMWQFGELGYGWGDDQCLKPGDGSDGECAPGDPGRTDPKPIPWELGYDEDPDRDRLYQTWGALNRLRASNEAFTSQDTDVSMRVGDGDVVRWIRLQHDDMDAIVVGNFGLTSRQERIPFTQPGTWYDFFNDTTVDVPGGTQTFWLQPGEFRVLTTEEQEAPPPDLVIPADEAGPPDEVSVDLTRSFGDPTDRENYQLVAVPGAAELPLDETLDGTPGEDWRAFFDDGTDEDFLVEFDDADPFTLQPGNGFWVLNDSDWSVEDTFETVSLTSDGEATIDMQDGWNIISNPLDVDVDWEQVQAANGFSADLWAWDGSWTAVETFESAQEGVAYYVRNEDGLDEIDVPYPGSIADRAASQAELPAAVQALEDGQTFSIDAHLEDEKIGQVQLGYSEGEEVIRRPMPRQMFSSAHLHVRDPGAEEALSALLTPEEKESDAGSAASFPLALQADPGTTVRLEATDLEALAPGGATLVNQTTGEQYPLTSEEPVTLSVDQEATDFDVVLGEVLPEEVDDTPDEVALKSNYPNPFRGSTTIGFALPEAMPVTIEVYDVLGRRVAMLADEEYQSGEHEITWDATDAGLSSGMYILRMTAEGETHVERMSVVR